MSRTRTRRVREEIADAITSSLEGLVLSKRLRRREVQRTYLKLGELLDNIDFLPRRKPLEQLKGEIRRRIYSLAYLPPESKGDIAMANEAVIVYTPPGQIIPKDYLAKVVGKYKTCHGVAASDGSTLGVVNIIGAPDLDKFMEEQEKLYKGLATLFVFESRDIEPNPDQLDLQPFTLLTSGGEPSVCVAMEGDFTGGVDKSARPPEFFLASTYLTEKFQPTFEALEGDVKKFFHAISGKATGQDLSSRWKTRGTMVFLGSGGEHLLFHDNPKMKELDWGFTSNTLEEASPAPAKSGKTLSLKERMAALASGGATEETLPVEPQKTDTKIPDPVGDEKVSPPKGITRNEDLRAWYVEQFGFLPPKYKDRPSFPRSLRDKHQAEKGGKKEPVKDLKDLPKVLEQQVVSHPIPIMSPKLKEAVTEFFDKETKVVDAEKIDAESKISCVNQVGKTLEETYGWSFETRRDLTHKFPMAGALLLHEMTYAYVKLLQKYDQLVTAVDRATAPTSVPPTKTLSLKERMAKMAAS